MYSRAGCGTEFVNNDLGIIRDSAAIHTEVQIAIVVPQAVYVGSKGYQNRTGGTCSVNRRGDGCGSGVGSRNNAGGTDCGNAGIRRSPGNSLAVGCSCCQGCHLIDVDRQVCCELLS